MTVNRKTLIATAHYLSRVMLTMLKTCESWRGGVEPDKRADRAIEQSAAGNVLVPEPA